MNTIKCIHCGKDIEISEALTQQIQGEVTKNLELEYREKLETARTKAIEESSEKIKSEFELQIKRAQEDAEHKSEQNKKLMDELTELTKELREQRTITEEAQFQMQKKLAEEEDKIRLDATKKAQEEQHSKIAELEKAKLDALKEVEQMKQKLQQGSQQAQGEVFELEFEELLTKHYPNDKLSPVAKGMRGGDIIQEVWDSRGNFCGKILWELKNTKTWQEPWIEKLRTDQRTINAEEAVLITEILPIDMQTAGFYKNIWVTQRPFVFPLADTLRAKIIQMYYVRSSNKSKDEKVEVLYSYLTGTEFKHRVEAIIEAFSSMQTEIEKEKRYFTNKWARDEKNIRLVIDSTVGMHGDLKGIMGATIPQIRGLDVLELEDGS